jgi:cell division septation protein DedD
MPKSLGSASRRRTLWIGLALLAVAVWMFFLGILVGRGTAPVRFDIDRLEQELAALRETLQEKERQLLASTQSAESEMGFTFFDDLKQSEEQGTVTFRVPPPPPEPETESDILPNAMPTQAPAPEPAAPLGEDVSTEIEPAPAETEPPDLPPGSSDDASAPETLKPKKSLKQATFKSAALARTPTPAQRSSTVANSGQSSKPKSQPVSRQAAPGAPRGSLTIQVSAVQDAATASAMVARLKSQGYDAHQSVARIPGKGLRYRIRVGRFTHSGEAQSVVRRLKQDNYDARVVNR